MSAKAKKKKKKSDKLAATQSKDVSHQPLVVQKLDGAIQHINHYPLDKFQQNLMSSVRMISIRSISSHYDHGDKNSQICIFDNKKTSIFILSHFAAVLVLSTTK